MLHLPLMPDYTFSFVQERNQENKKGKLAFAKYLRATCRGLWCFPADFFILRGTCVSAMPSYTVTISTGSQWFAGTDDYIYITLVGTEGCSERTLLDKPLYNDFERGAVSGVTQGFIAGYIRFYVLMNGEHQ